MIFVHHVLKLSNFYCKLRYHKTYSCLTLVFKRYRPFEGNCLMSWQGAPTNSSLACEFRLFHLADSTWPSHPLRAHLSGLHSCRKKSSPWIGTELVIALKLIREHDWHDEDDEAFKLHIKKLHVATMRPWRANTRVKTKLYIPFTILMITLKYTKPPKQK